MANVSIALLDSGSSNTDATSYATNSFTATAGRVLHVYVLNEKANPPGTPTIAGLGGTWAEVTHKDFDSAATPTRKLTLLQGVGCSGTGTLTIDFGASTQRSCCWGVVEDTHANTTTPDVVANRQVGSDETADTSALAAGDLTFGAFGSTENRPLVGVALDANQAVTPNIAPDTLWTELLDVGSTATASRLEVMWADSTADTTPTASAGGNTKAAWIGIEVQAAVAAGGGNPWYARAQQ